MLNWAIKLKFFIYFFMSMLSEIEKFMGSAEASINYRIVNLGGKSLYIEGLKAVVSFGVNEMQFQLKHSLLSVVGSQLKIKYLDKTTCIIVGEITSVVSK